LAQLTSLTLGENRKRNIDLAALEGGRFLKQLFIQGHAKNIDVVANLPSLQSLSLSAFAKTNRLDFIAPIATLRELMLILGGRADVDDLSSASLEILQIVRVRGLASFGDLARFPALTALRVEDQLQLTSLDLSGAQLERLWLYNCKKLAVLRGLELQSRLREFCASRVALDLDALRDRNWPPTMRSVSLYSGSKKWNDEVRTTLAARGLAEDLKRWP